jgi:radical SAM superfamily enzyme YgiQ (UPF0313 family)
MKTKVGLVQINTSFLNQEYLPLSLGMLLAYAKKNLDTYDDFEFLLPIYKRLLVKDAVERLSEAQIVFFSFYDWNVRISLEIAKQLKAKNPETIIVFGGPGIPHKEVREFLETNLFIDIACIGNGEFSFTEILRNYPTRMWSGIDGVNFFDEDGFHYAPEATRITEIDSLPSPFIDGIFSPLMEANRGVEWIALWETNRGCPFSCTYCAWGCANQSKVYFYSLERLQQEIEWMAKNKIGFITCCDSNFGMYERDYDIVKSIAQAKAQHGYPEAISVQSTKQFKPYTYQTYKLLADAKLSNSIMVSLQSTNKKTLKAIKRANINIKLFKEIEQNLNFFGVKSFSDVILGLPEETYDSFVDGLALIMENGQHDRAFINDCSILANAEMADESYQEKYGIVTVDRMVINRHEVIRNEEVVEKERLIAATNSMSRNDWMRARAFAWEVSLLHYNKLLQIPFVILNKQFGVGYRELIEVFLEGKLPVIFQDIKDFFADMARKSQEGDPPLCRSDEWLGIWWPPEAYKFIELCTKDKLNEFYWTAEVLLADFLHRKGITFLDYGGILKDSIELNSNLIKLPRQASDKTLRLSFNLWEVYRGVLTGEETNLEEGDFTYRILRSKEVWDSWVEWYEKMVFIQHKKGTYIYNCERI